ncbi:MAG: hypothetical protein EXR95_04040 [Gemmatimonadetes bacterium]|nr:hypothetical protein [Gemmatimonadota bacterium]
MLALAHAAGALPIHLGASVPAAPLLICSALLPIPLWLRPHARAGLLAAALAGSLGALAHAAADRRDCRRQLEDGATLVVRGRLPGPALGGRGFLDVETGLGPGCAVEVPVSLGRGVALPPAGPLIAARERAVPWTVTTRGTRLRVDGLELEVVHPSGPPAGSEADPNDVSVVLLIRYGAFTALLDGDAPSRVEDALSDSIGPVDVLKVAHHGSATSSSAAFLDRIRPSLALVSVGMGNTFWHPNPDVVRRLEEVGAQVLRTDLNGRVVVRARADGSWTATPEWPD